MPIEVIVEFMSDNDTYKFYMQFWRHFLVNDEVMVDTVNLEHMTWNSE